MKRFGHIVFVLTLALSWCGSLWAQTPKVSKKVTSTEGRDFYVGWLLNGESALTPSIDPNLKLNLYISSRFDNTIVIQTVGGLTTRNIPAGMTDTVEINPSIVYVDKGSDQTEKVLEKGVRVYSQNGKVFSLIASNKNGITAEGTASFDATQVIPIEGLGCEYIIHTNDIDRFANQFMIVGTENGTDVTINLSADSKSYQASEAYPTIHLNAREVYLVTSSKPNADFSGTTICATQPVAVFNGSTSVLIPNQNGMTDDHAYEQAMPITKWGKQFVVPMTANFTSSNMLEIMAQKDGTSVTISGHTIQNQKTLSSGEPWRIDLNTTTCPSGVVFVESSQPVTTYLYTTSAGRNSYTHPVTGEYTLQGDPSSTLIPPVEHFTDSTIFFTYKNPDENAQLVAYVNIWAKTSALSSLRMDGNDISSNFQTVTSHTEYSFARMPVSEGTHVVTAAEKAFTGYTYMLDAGQASLYTIGYDFAMKEDSLFLKGDAGDYQVHWSTWKNKAISTSESGWHLDKTLLDNGKYLLDSVIICDKTSLTFPIKCYNAWDKVRWEVTGSEQGPMPVTSAEQTPATAPRPELTHLFQLQPIEVNDNPYEDFEVSGVVIRQPLMCNNIPEDKWERDTFNTVVRVMRQYNDTTWKAICDGDEFEFFKDTIWSGTTYTLQATTFNNTTDDATHVKYSVGANVWTRSYKSSNGCDSLSTLKLFVCTPSFEQKDTVICEDGMQGLDYGDFFQKYKGTMTWPKGENTLRDTLRAKSCMRGPVWAEFEPHCTDFNGCDSVLELHLNVKAVVRNTKRQNQCMSGGTIFTWTEEGSGMTLMTFSVDTMQLDHEYTYHVNRKYVDCEGCPNGGCDSVRNTLYLTFISDAGQTHTIHVCQGKDTTYISKTNTNARQYFNSNGRLCNTPYKFDLPVDVVNSSGEVMCSFTDTLTFFVDTVYKDQMTYDTVCWNPDATDQVYTKWGATHPKYASIPVTAPGEFTYVDTLKTASCGDGCGKCDSICVLVLRVGEPYLESKIEDLCDNDSMSWQDTLFYGPKFDETKLPAGRICKKITTTTYTSRRDTVSRYKCDSVLTLSVSVHPTYLAEDKEVSICANESYDFYGTTYNVPGAPEVWTPGNTYTLEFKDHTALYGCDSLVRHRVTVYPVYLNENETNDTVCQVISETPVYYEWEGAAHTAWNNRKLQKLNTAGTYNLVDSLATVHGCDSVIHRTLVIMPSYEITVSRVMSSEDTIMWEGRIYAGQKAVFDNPAGLPVQVCTGFLEVTDSLRTNPIGPNDCDSVRILKLKIGQIFRDTVYDATCANCGTYNWTIKSPIDGHDTTIYISDLPNAYDTRIYYDSLKTSMDYDSIYVLYLKAYPNYNYTAADAVCQGQPYLWADHMPGDNAVVHRLFVDGNPITTIPTGTHGIIEVVDSMQTDTITHIHPKGEVKLQCDSVWTLTLTIHPTYNNHYVTLTDDIYMASNDTLSHFVYPHTLFVGYDFDSVAAGVTHADLEQRYDTVVYIPASDGELHTDSVRGTSVFGCDSVHYVNVHICEIRFRQLYDTIADNDTTWYFGGETIYGEHTQPLVTGHRFHFYDDGSPVDYEVATGREVREYLFIDTLKTASGCDSIVHDSIFVYPAYRFEFDTAVCSNRAYNWRNYTNLNRGSNGYYYDSVNYWVGTHQFDSVFVLGLEILPSGYWSFDTTICMNDTIHWYYQTIYYQNNGLKYVEAMYKDSLSKCGDVYHLDLHFAPFYGAGLVEYDTICQDDPYEWISPGETKPHTEALYDGNGNRISVIPTDVIGDFVYYDSLKTKSCHCDSVYTLYLHIDPTYRFYTDTAICTGDVFEWVLKDQQGNDSVVSYSSETSVHLFDTLKNATATLCDSSYYLHVFVDQPYDIYLDTTLCAADEHFSWNGKSYDDLIAASKTWNDPQEFFDTIFAKTLRGHCDSTMYLHLTIGPSGDSVWTDSVCVGETYMLFDRAITQPGVYEMRHENAWGCEVKYILTLVHIPATRFELSVEPVCYDENGIATSYTIHYTYEGEFAPIAYSLRYGAEALNSGFEDEEDIPLNGAQSIALPVPNSSARSYPRPGYYDAVIAFQNGVCLSDSLMRYPFKMELRYPSWIMEQRYNDLIALLNESYNGGNYTWSAYQWYENDQKMEGQTKPYLHVATGLTTNAEYSVELTRTDDEVTVRTCPLVAVYKSDDITPKMGYLAITPTCVVTAHPYVSILSRHDGTYRVTTSNGTAVSDGVFRAEVTEIALPASEGMYIVQLWSNETPEEPYRAIKVIVSKQCPNCDISSF